jgi:aspartyl protease family protein
MVDKNNTNVKYIGKGMIIAAWVLVLGLLLMFFNQMLSIQRNPNQEISSHLSSDNIRIVVLKRNRSGHYVATGLINNYPVELMLDTGATHVSVPAKLAEKLNLKRGAPVNTITANGTITTYTTILDKVQLGDIVLHKVRASLNPYSNDVLLGMSFLKKLEFTQRGNTLTIKQYL